ncbi:restriction endonuclease subunit S [Gallibacterium anatis]|uniref:restriction endonuclease subunit S n=1 Tax=Gallibacterium anatis TaxID=750 RepID=UPI000BA1131E|nr:restriction endonuclease subunit S [Gallibacterium anatis]WAX72641.1 restriction endonuclease subunit S [Gallibacterium anatis]
MTKNPYAWEKCKLGEVAKYRNGKAHEQNISTNGQYIVVNSKFISSNGYVKKYSEYQIEPLYKNDITFVLSDVPNGKALAKTFLIESDNLYTLNQRVAAFSTLKNNDSYFLNIILDRNNYFLSFDSGVGQTNLSISDVMGFNFHIPTLPEQQKIGNLFKQLDRLITLHKRKWDDVILLKKALLQKMFPKNGSDFPEIRFPEFTDAWEKCKLGEVLNVTSVKRIHQSDWRNEGIRFLRARDLVSELKGEKNTDLLYISEEKYNEYSKISGKVEYGDLLVTGVGTIGVPYLVKNQEKIYFKDGNIIWFQNHNKIDGNFLFFSFMSPSIKSFINATAGVGTVGTYTIESGKKTPISLPTLPEQQKIGTLFRRLDRLITLHK